MTLILVREEERIFLSGPELPPCFCTLEAEDCFLGPKFPGQTTEAILPSVRQGTL